MPGLRGEGVRDEAAALRPHDELAQRVRLGRRGDRHLERRFDVDERVQAVVLASPDDAVRTTDAGRVEPGTPRVVAHAREGAADEPGEDEMLRPPLGLGGKRASSEAAAGISALVDRDVELEGL